MFTPHHGVHRDLGKIGLTTENVANFVKFFFQQSQLFGLFYGGGTALLTKQALGVGLVAGYSFLVTLVLGFVIEKTIGFRISKDAEVEGIDLSEHAETAYEMSSSSRGGAF